MYVLYASDREQVARLSHLFEMHFEPMLRKLEVFTREGHVPPDLKEIPQYLHVCRWPFRRLEYSFALDILLEHLKPGDRYLDAGCGVTPLSHVIAARMIETDACDNDARLIDNLCALDTERIYGSRVTFSHQDLRRTTFADATFDAISCISVLEHIPAPGDQAALRELLRILKPGGVLVLTVDYTPTSDTGVNRLGYYARRAVVLAKSGNFAEISKGLWRKVQAQQAVREGKAHIARSAHQCFEIGHLEQDILPVLAGEEVLSRLPFSRELHTVTPDHARRFWSIDGLYDPDHFRAVLPVAVSIRTSA